MEAKGVFLELCTYDSAYFPLLIRIKPSPLLTSTAVGSLFFASKLKTSTLP